MVSRRVALRGAFAVGLLGATGIPLTGCSEDSASAAGPAPEPTGTSRPSASTTPRTKSDVYPRNPEPRPSRAAAASTPAPLPPGAVARTSDIPVGGGRTYPDHKLVITQPTAGTFRGFSATCTHTGCLVDEVANRQIICPCHGSRFAIADGKVEKGPALLPLPKQAIAVGADGSIRKA